MDAVYQARSQGQDLYKRIEASTRKNHATVRSDLQDAATQAQQLASSLRRLMIDQRADAKQHLEDAASLLEAVAADEKNIANRGEADLRRTNAEMLERTRDALEHISRAVAAKRAAVEQHA